MRLDDLAPELLQYCVYSGHLSTEDILRLACSSKDMLDRLTGDDYALARLRATCGLETCIVKGWSRAFVFALQTQKPNVRMFFRACDMDRTEILEALLEWNKTGK